MPDYKTAPLASTKIPDGIPFIVANEAAERFSYYGMRAILVIFMTRYLMDATGQLAILTEQEAQGQETTSTDKVIQKASSGDFRVQNIAVNSAIASTLNTNQ